MPLYGAPEQIEDLAPHLRLRRGDPIERAQLRAAPLVCASGRKQKAHESEGRLTERHDSFLIGRHRHRGREIVDVRRFVRRESAPVVVRQKRRVSQLDGIGEVARKRAEKPIELLGELRRSETMLGRRRRELQEKRPRVLTKGFGKRRHQLIDEPWRTQKIGVPLAQASLLSRCRLDDGSRRFGDARKTGRKLRTIAVEVGLRDRRIEAAVDPDGREQRIPVKGVRKLTAENMVASAFTAPHVTVFLTVDVTRSVRALDRLRALPEWREARVSPLLLVAKAALLAIKRYPLVNSSWAADVSSRNAQPGESERPLEEIVVKDYVNLGIAAATERGLIVPNIKDADRLSLRELADAMTALVQTAKAGRTQPADMSRGTFSITNVGVFGVDTGTPILPPGEAAILCFGAIREQPWVHRGKVKPRQVTTLGMSFDHRIIDGELGAKFVRDVGAFLADPEATLLAWC